jgi:hypothetical protein
LRFIWSFDSRVSIVAMEQSMNMDFLDGMLVVMIPSMLTVAWLVWHAADYRRS